VTTYAITGSSGYVGTRMTRWLLEQDPTARIIGFDIRPPRVTSARLEFHHLDVRDPRLGELLDGRGVVSLLHFAFVLDPLYDEQEMHDIDLGGTRNVLAAVTRAKIPHLLATSSTTAYGALPDNPRRLVESDSPRAARDFSYAHDKRLMDDLLRDFARQHPDVGVCVLRPCIVLGPNVANYIAYNLLALPVTALLDGEDPELQFIHEDDLVRLVALCVERRSAGIYNAVGEGTLTSTEIARMAGKRALKLPHRVVWGAVWAVNKVRILDFSMPPGVLAFFRNSWVASGEKAQQELGFVPAYSSRQCFEILVGRKDEVIASFKERIKARGKR
jgi:UDP-glucose 4-epimerase